MKTHINVLTLTALLSALSLNAAESSGQIAAQRYPFSELDKELFFNFETEKMESPFSTASVKTFPKDTWVTIEENAYNTLHEHALKRSGDSGLEATRSMYNTPQENYTARQDCKRIADVSTKSWERFKFMQTTGNHSEKVQLSPRNLARLLQQSHSITTVFLLMTGSKDDFMLEIKLGDALFTAPPLLKNFILANGDHQQEKPVRWAR